MGLYAFAISAQWILVGLFGTGPGVAVVRLSVEQFASGNGQKAAGIAIMAAGTAITGTVAVAIVGGTAAEISSGSGFSATAAVLVAIWAGGRSVLECLRSSLLSQELYGRVAVLTVAGAIVGLCALGLILATGDLTIERILLAHAIGQTASGLLATAFLIPLWRMGAELSATSYRQLVAYAKWPTLSEGTKLLHSHIGPVILLAVAGAEQAGLYGLGRYPAYVFGVVGLSLYQYWLPQAALHGIDRRLREFLRRQMKLATLAAVTMLLGAVLIRPLISMLGENLASGTYLLIPNTLDFSLIVLVLPIEAAFHGLRRPQLDFFVRAVKLPLLLALAFFLSSKYGAAGMVWSQVLAGAAALSMAYGVLRKFIGSEPESTQSPAEQKDL
jgi:hypothetical protein